MENKQGMKLSSRIGVLEEDEEEEKLDCTFSMGIGRKSKHRVAKRGL